VDDARFDDRVSAVSTADDLRAAGAMSTRGSTAATRPSGSSRAPARSTPSRS
jgi:hypothetical protein